MRVVGGTDIKEASRTGIIFAALNLTQADKLRSLGCVITEIKPIKTIVTSPVLPPTPVAGTPVYTPSELTAIAGLDAVRAITDPPLYGRNLNIAVIDTGIRETHDLLRGHIVHSRNFTTDPMRDGFDHGTAVASVIASAAPECGILNIKVLDDEGEGTEEEVVLGIDHILTLRDTNPEVAPWVVNLSLGSYDDGNPNNPLRVACRAAINEGVMVIAAAGNDGPNPGTIMNPACERFVGAVGSVGLNPFLISEFSSRGPTKEGIVKPESVFFGENIILASSVSDSATAAKSGTSFSCPFGTAVVLLTEEGITRSVTYTGVIPKGIDPTLVRLFTAEELVDKWSVRIGVKPEGEPAGKDNNYGGGVPLGALILEVMQPSLNISSMLQMVVVVGMMGMMMKQIK